MKNFTKMIGKLPFVGKAVIGLLIFRFYNSADCMDRRNRFIPLAFLLIAFVFLHGLQAQLGIKGLGFSAPMAVKILFGLYTLINICVLVAHLYLLVRCTIFFLKKNMYPKVERTRKKSSDKQETLMLMVTVGGQAIFLSCYLTYG
ncbi:MAG TPA: hypothetical protein VGE63_01495 [Candidatus Paceibacterota bacterium]